jgi:hypothetical protein
VNCEQYMNELGLKLINSSRIYHKHVKLTIPFEFFRRLLQANGRVSPQTSICQLLNFSVQFMNSRESRTV